MRQTPGSRKQIVTFAIGFGVISDLVIVGFPVLLSYILGHNLDVTPFRFLLVLFGWGGLGAGESMWFSARRQKDARLERIAAILLIAAIYILGVLAGSLMHGFFGIDQ